MDSKYISKVQCRSCLRFKAIESFEGGIICADCRALGKMSSPLAGSDVIESCDICARREPRYDMYSLGMAMVCGDCYELHRHKRAWR